MSIARPLKCGLPLPVPKGGAGGVVNAYNVLYSDSAGTGAIFVDGTTRLVAEFTFTAGQGDNISASNFLFA
jgi:hypothetical protein